MLFAFFSIYVPWSFECGKSFNLSLLMLQYLMLFYTDIIAVYNVSDMTNIK